MKVVYLAPADIQIARVDRQCLVRFCEAMHRLDADVELVAMRIALLDVELSTSDPLDLYGLRSRFPAKLVHVPVGQESSNWWIALNRFRVHLGAGISVIRQTDRRAPVVFYARNYSPILGLFVLRALSRSNVLLALEVHIPPRNAFQRFLLRRADRVIANTHALAADLTASGYADPNNVLGTHQGVDLEAVEADSLSKAEARRRLGLPADEALVVYTGKIYWGYEEVEYILRAARCLERRDSAVRVLLVGGRGDHVARFRDRISVSGPRNTSFLGFVPPSDVHLYQKAADALLLYYPSGIELNRYRSPGKLFQYMASGNPIVACDLPVIREVLGEDPAAVLVPQDSPDKLADAIDGILRDKTESARLAALARERVERFTWEARARSILDFLENGGQGSQSRAVTAADSIEGRSAGEGRDARRRGDHV
jgi:glycosyltransferase involved in cell wall biosynthesis